MSSSVRAACLFAVLLPGPVAGQCHANGVHRSELAKGMEYAVL